MADIIPHCAKVVNIVPPCDKDVLFYNILCMLPPPHPTSQLPAYGYQLDTYYWTYTLAGSAYEPCPLSRQKPYEEHQAMGVYEVYSKEVHICGVCPLHLLSTFKSAYQWLLTKHLLIYLYHTSFNQDMHMVHGLPPVGHRYSQTDRTVR